MALIQAILSIFENKNNQLRYMDMGSVRVLVLSKAPLYYLLSQIEMSQTNNHISITFIFWFN
ncbi:hypothetical protein PPACK8108_LOCUS25963 [Phakopsora pachyrhizi]|uniref:Uncharacterized protein n=1 Tax=Phakopsora pachyrhizi TaxID=170000 RepID=A0AAV0BT18_PHAPC|nr:hypothetical protein PPACK8108_LOCUS25963 [Phakopsora pachyrhizi]